MMDCACFSLKPRRIKSPRLTVLGLNGKVSTRRGAAAERAASAAGECGASRRTMTRPPAPRLPPEEDPFAPLGMTILSF